jgi:hypothetical protein
MVRCNVMVWTDKTGEGGLLKVVISSDSTMAGATLVVTEAQAIQRTPLTETAAEWRYMERKWCKRLWQCSALQCSAFR